MVAAIATIICWPRTYSSTAELYVRPGRESLTLDPTATTGETLTLRTSEQVAVNSVLEVLNSDAVAEKVVERHGSDAVLAGRTAGTTRASGSGYGGKQATWLSEAVKPLSQLRSQIASLDPIDEREAAIKKIRRETKARTAQASNVVTIECITDSPEEAQSIASALTDAFMEEYVRIHRTPGSREFFADQTELLAKELATAVNALRVEKDRFGTLSVDGQRGMLESQMSRINGRMLEIDGLVAASTTEIDRLTEMLDSMSPKILSQSVSGRGHVATDGMRQQLYELEIREKELLSTHTDESPKVQAVRRQREAVEAILNEQPMDRTEVTESINPIYQILDQRQLELQATTGSLQGEKRELQKQQTALRQRLKEFNEHEVLVASLQRNVTLLESQYFAHAKNLEQARIDRALEEDRISSINILQPATFRSDPVNPNKKLVFVVGVLFGVAGAIALTLIPELFHNTIRTDTEVESHLGLPVLVAIPRNSTYATVMR